MKTKIPILIAAGLFIAITTNAQYGPSYHENRVIIQAHIGFPIPVPVVYNDDYYHPAPVCYEDGNAGYVRYDERHDWRAEQYERYCRENRWRRMSRKEFYRDHCDSRANSYYAPRKVVEYRRY
jgi:hypothetical protein